MQPCPPPQGEGAGAAVGESPWPVRQPCPPPQGGGAGTAVGESPPPLWQPCPLSQGWGAGAGMTRSPRPLKQPCPPLQGAGHGAAVAKSPRGAAARSACLELVAWSGATPWPKGWSAAWSRCPVCNRSTCAVSAGSSRAASAASVVTGMGSSQLGSWASAVDSRRASWTTPRRPGLRITMGWFGSPRGPRGCQAMDLGA